MFNDCGVLTLTRSWQETQPLQDTLPPRHAVESDESEDEGSYPQLEIVKRKVPRLDPNIVVDWHGPQAKLRPLLIALDEAGREWAGSVGLGEVRGRILVDDVEVASAYCPLWAEITVVVISLRLPLYAMHEFASMVITTARPTSVVIIDAYPVPSFISSTFPPLHPPVRYISTTAESKTILPPNVELFYPPNLVQSLAASFLSILEAFTCATPATLLLLPSAHIPPPAPLDFSSHSRPAIHEEWEPSIITKLHGAVSAFLGVDTPWSVRHISKNPSSGRVSRKGDIGEGGMYI